MSEYRYFQNKVGRVESSRDGAWRAKHVPDETEVQVVPLDAVVIRREDLPTWEPWELDLLTAAMDETQARGEALVAVAKWAHIRENPPVDPEETAQIAALSREYSAFCLSGNNGGVWNEIAAQMYKAGFRIEEAGK